MKSNSKNISMAGCLRSLEGGKCTASISIDLAAIDAAPVEEFFGLYNHLHKSLSQALVLLKGRLSPAKPVLIIGLEVRANFAPSGPVLFSVPSEG